MNCNEEFIIKLLGKFTLELGLNWEQQREFRKLVYLSLEGYDVLTTEKSLVASDFDDKINLYLAVKKLAGYSEHTLKNYGYALRQVSSVIIKPVSMITKADLTLFLIKFSQGRAKSTQQSMIFYLKGFFAWLENEEIITKNPTKTLENMRLPKRVKKPLEIVEIEKVRLECNNTRDRAIIEFLLATGCRVSELVKLNKRDINLYENTVDIISGKGDKQRTTYINDKAKLYLQKYLDTRNDDNEALFVGFNTPHRRIGTRRVQMIVSDLKIKAKIEGKVISPHSYRRTTATHLSNSGASITTIQKILGHSSIETTMKYITVDDVNVRYEHKKHALM